MSKGFTIVELAIVIAVIGVLYAVTLWAIQPDLIKKRGRDAVRITDLGSLESAIENYVADKGFPPDVIGALRVSDIPASPSASPALANGNGWIFQNLGGYVEKLPVDPLNNGASIYRYKRVGKYYELDASLENNSPQMLNTGKDGDGGNSSTRFEKGTDLTILGD